MIFIDYPASVFLGDDLSLVIIRIQMILFVIMYDSFNMFVIIIDAVLNFFYLNGKTM